MKLFFYLFFLLSFSFASNLNNKLNNLIIIAEKDYPPITFINKKGEPDGLAVEVTKIIMKNLHLKQKIKMLPWARAYNLLLKKHNVVLFSVSRTKERENLFQWVGPIYYMKSSFYVRKNSPVKIESLNDAKKLKKIGTYRDSFNEQFLKQHGFKNLESTTNNVLNIKKLMHNRLDAIVATNVTVKEMLKKAGYSINDVKNIYTFMDVGVYYAFSKDVPAELVNKWHREFEKIKNSGKLEEIRNKWLH